jgi:hypothetical protein
MDINQRFRAARHLPGRFSSESSQIGATAENSQKPEKI